jgi:hypothetical protein
MEQKDSGSVSNFIGKLKRKLMKINMKNSVHDHKMKNIFKKTLVEKPL